MVRSAFLNLLILLSPTGLWIDSDGTTRTVTCPKSFEEESLVRLPAGCSLTAPAVAYTRHEFLQTQEAITELTLQRDHWEDMAKREKKLRKEVEKDLETLINDFDLQYKILQSTCKSELDCPKLKPALFGSALTLTLCTGAWVTSKMLK